MNDLMKSLVEKRKDRVIKDTLLSDDFLEMIKKNTDPFNTLIAYYNCRCKSYLFLS